MSQTEQELEIKFQQILADMLDNEASEADIQLLLNNSNRPAMLSLWQRYHRHRAVLAGQTWSTDAALEDFLRVLNQKLTASESEAKADVVYVKAYDRPSKMAQRFGAWAFSWIGRMPSFAWVATTSAAAVVVLTLSLMINYSPTSNVDSAVSRVSSTTDETHTSRPSLSGTTREAAELQFVQQLVSAYTLNHANNRVVNTHFVPFTKMSTYQTSLAGTGENSRLKRYAPVQYDNR